MPDARSRAAIQICLDLSVLIEALRLARISRYGAANHLERIAEQMTESWELSDCIMELRRNRVSGEAIAARLHTLMTKMEPQ